MSGLEAVIPDISATYYIGRLCKKQGVDEPSRILPGVFINRQQLIITHQELSYRFQRSRKEMAFNFARNLLMYSPRTLHAHRDLLYRNDPAGGPLDYDQIMWAMLIHLQPIFAMVDLTIVRTVTGDKRKAGNGINTLLSVRQL